jgi:hypothetical protein
MLTETDLCNESLAKTGGAGDQATGSGFISSIDDSDKISKACKTLLPVCRQKAITDLAAVGCPFRETVKYADLGAEAAEESLPEIGGWEYAFNLPTDCLAMSRLIDEDFASITERRTEYQYESILNKDKNGKILLTNNLTNTAQDSAFVEYAVDVASPAAFSLALKECIVVLLAAELCPMVGKDTKFRQSLLLEYEQLAKPNAKKYNQSQFNNYEQDEPENYLGGRDEG